jgi:hypothetical protein
MTLANTETGELVEFDRAAAERRAERIRLRLDAIADNYATVMPMIREAIEKRDDLALGYRSPGEYVSDRFGGALTRLGVEVRREVVRELTEAGMTTRAIAPVVGVSNKTVSLDQRAPVTPVTPQTPVPAPEGEAEADAGITPRGEAVPSSVAPPEDKGAPEPPAPRPAVTGIDGKTYTRPEPKPKAQPSRKPLPDSFFDAAYDLNKAVDRVERLTNDDRFPRNAEQVAAKHRSDLTRAVEALSRVLDLFNTN